MIAALCLGIVMAVTGGSMKEDNIPPAAITDLAVAPFGAHGFRFSFTCPGDDGLTGTSHEFQARYSTEGPIASENAWEGASLLPQYTGWVSFNRPGGDMAWVDLTQIPASGTKKWLAVRFRDGAGNVAPLSNSPAWDYVPE